MRKIINDDSPYYSKRVLYLILSLSLLKLFVAASIDLGTDESYYWLYSQSLQINYFDHPPMIAIWIRFFTANLLLEQYEIFIRLGSIIGCGISTWFIYKILETIHSKRVGWYAACLYNASLYASITAGFMATPDAPQMVFYTLSMWMLARIFADEKKILNWVIFGLASGFCIMSKVHGIYVWIGLLLYILINKRKWFSYYQFYIAIMIALIIASPILFWNIANDFVTYKFHSNRVVINHSGINWAGFCKEIIGEIIINNPINIGLIFFALINKNKIFPIKNTAIPVFNYIGLSLLFTILFIALFRETLPHWSGVAYVALIPVAAIKLNNLRQQIISFPGLLKWSIGYLVFILIGIYSIINFYPGNFTKGSKENYGHGDMSIDNYGWSLAAPKIAAIYFNEVKKNNLPKNTPFVCRRWWGAHLEYYCCLPNNIYMIGLGEVNELHHYTWMNTLRKEKVDLTNAFCVVPSNDRYDPSEKYKKYYSGIDSITSIEITRQYKPTQYFTIYKLSGWKNNLPEIK